MSLSGLTGDDHEALDDLAKLTPMDLGHITFRMSPKVRDFLVGLVNAARQEGSAEDDGAAMRHTLSVHETNKSDRTEGVAALQQAGEPVAWRPIENAPKDGTIIDVWRPEGGRDTVFWGFPSHECGEMGQYCDSEWHSIRAPGWVCSTFNQLVGRKHAPFTHWMPLPLAPLPQQTALVEQGVEKIIAPHEPAACGEGTLPSPSEPPRPAGGEV